MRSQFVWCTVLPLKHGKGAHGIVEVLRRDLKTARQLGHAGCTVESCRFDRFPLSSLEHIWRQVPAADPRRDGLLPDLATDDFRLTEFVIVGGCSHMMCTTHSVGRCSSFQIKGLGLLRNANVTVESLRNSVASKICTSSSGLRCL